MQVAICSLCTVLKVSPGVLAGSGMSRPNADKQHTLKTSDTEGDYRIGGDTVLRKETKFVGFGKIARCVFGQYAVAVEKHDASLPWPVRFELPVSGWFKRFDVGNVLDRYVFFSDCDDVLHSWLKWWDDGKFT